MPAAHLQLAADRPGQRAGGVGAMPVALPHGGAQPLPGASRLRCDHGPYSLGLAVRAALPHGAGVCTRRGEGRRWRAIAG